MELNNEVMGNEVMGNEVMNNEVMNNEVMNNEVMGNEVMNNEILEQDPDVDYFSDGENESDEEIETIDLTDNPIYQLLSSFFENDEGRNICDVLTQINSSIKDTNSSINSNTDVLKNIVNKLDSIQFDTGDEGEEDNEVDDEEYEGDN
jgi:hypothetical protein